MLVQLTTNYNKNVITQGSGKGEKHGTDTPTQGTVTLFQEVTLGPSIMQTQCLVFPKVPWEPNGHCGRIKKGRPLGVIRTEEGLTMPFDSFKCKCASLRS